MTRTAKDSVREHKAAATTAGIRHIAGAVAGVLSMVVIAPVRDVGGPVGHRCGALRCGRVGRAARARHGALGRQQAGRRVGDRG